MPYVRRTASGRISAVYDRPSRDAKERVRANDPEMLRFLGLAPTQSAATTAILSAPADLPLDGEPAYQYEAAAATPEPATPAPAHPSPKIAASDTAAPDDQVTDFSLPDDMPEEMPEEMPVEEDDGFGDQFGIEDIEEAPCAPSPAPEPADAADAPVFEAGDMPSGTAPAERTAPPSASSAKPPLPAPAGPNPRGGPGPSANATPESKSANGEGGPGDDSAIQQLDASDMEMARITEDLIDLLIGRNIINFTDFPNMAQRKLINRRALRSNMSALTNLVSDEENIF